MKKVLEVYCKKNWLKWQITWNHVNIKVQHPSGTSEIHLRLNTRLKCSSTVQRTKN